MSTTGLVPAKEEVSFYSDTEGVQVTNSRLIIGSTTYAMLNITSVSCAFEKPPRGGPMSFILLGVSSFIAGLAASSPMFIVFGVPMLLVGGYWWKVQKIKYHLLVTSASGEAKAVTSTDFQRVNAIVQAVNEAIIGRG